MYANNIALASNYLPIFDSLYRANSRTAILDAAANKVKFLNANTIYIYKPALEGLGDYNRNLGYPTGSVSGSWETMTLSQDRAKSFLVDAMDNEESVGQAYGTLIEEFMAQHVIPETDAYRFAKIAGTANISGANADITVGSTDVPSLISTAEMTMGDDEVPEEGRILFVSEKTYAALKAKIVRTVQNNEKGINTVVETYDDMRVVKVPKGRFNTAIVLKDGVTSGQTEGGYSIPTGTSYPINFMIVHPSAVISVVKHDIPRIFNPLETQVANAWKFDYRLYYDIFVLEKKVKGIYMHRASTAN